MPSRARRGRPLVRNAAVVALRAVLALAVAVVAWGGQLWPLAPLAALFAIWALADGVCVLGWALVGARRGERSAPLLLAGAAGLAAGATAALIHDPEVHAFVWLLACWALASGLATTGAALLLPGRGRGGLAATGLLAVAWGTLLLLWPVPGPGTLARWLAALALGLAFAHAGLVWRLMSTRRIEPDA